MTFLGSGEERSGGVIDVVLEMSRPVGRAVGVEVVKCVYVCTVQYGMMGTSVGVCNIGCCTVVVWWGTGWGDRVCVCTVMGGDLVSGVDNDTVVGEGVVWLHARCSTVMMKVRRWRKR